MVKDKKTLRESLQDTSNINFIKYLIDKRGLARDSETKEELVSAVVETMLAQESYYETHFEQGFKSYAKLVLTQVFDRMVKKPDALNGELVYLDAPVKAGEQGEETVGSHEMLCKSDLLVESERFFTQGGRPSELTYYLSQLPDQQSDVFALKAVYGHTHEEIAELLGIGVDYSRKLYLEAKRELSAFRSSEMEYESRMQLGPLSGRLMTNDASMGGVWNDWSWREENAEPGPVKEYTPGEILDYVLERGDLV
jgi:DNA-directed RNA polymerase specialized sigma24 family protein